jgi:peptidoglycan/xylan/chitin deacetylase (PgdA/CDA1 family)
MPQLCSLPTQGTAAGYCRAGTIPWILTIDLPNCRSPKACAEKWTLLNLSAVLDCLERLGFRATFFVCEDVAKIQGAALRHLVSHDCEIACHGSVIPRAGQSTPEVFRQHARGLRQLLEDTAGVPVTGFRVADFSIDRHSLAALEILAEEGFEYDSSINPAHQPNLPRVATVVRTGSGPVVEIPLTTARVFGWEVPYGAAGWCGMPGTLMEAKLLDVWHRQQLPGMICLTPSDLDELRFTDRIRRISATSTLSCVTAREVAVDLMARSVVVEPGVELASMTPRPSWLRRYLYEVDSY